MITQASGAFSQFGIEHTFINPKVKNPDYNANAFICSSQTFRRRINKDEWRGLFNRPKTMVVIDEADRQEFNYLFESGLLDNIPTLGFSGTFARTGNMRQLGMDYDVIVKGAPPKRLVELGYLVPDRYYSVSEPDMSDVQYDSKVGDYNSSAVYKKFHKKEMYQGMVDNYMTHTPNTKVLGFGANQIHSVHMAVEFQKAGVDAMYLISGIKKPKKPDEWVNEGQRIKYERDLELYMTERQYSALTGKRSDILSQFKKGKIQGLMNAGLFGTGLDVPDLETVIINKSTLSIREYLQITGRIVRISPETGKIFGNVIDMANHAYRKDSPFGRYMDSRDWGLWHEKTKGGGVAATKLCDPYDKDKNGKAGCNRLIHISMQSCPFCGKVFMTEKELQEKELKEIAYGDMPEEEVLIDNMNAKQLFAYRKLKKYKMPWIGRQILNRERLNCISQGKSEDYARASGLKKVKEAYKNEGYKHKYIEDHILKYL